MKVGILGTDKSNHNYKKIYGWIDAFSKICEVVHITELDNEIIINKIVTDEKIDVLFGETYPSVFSNIDYTNLKAFVWWGDIAIELSMKVAEEFKNTKFIMAHKSIMSKESLSHFSKVHNTQMYMEIDIPRIIDIFENSKKIDRHTHKITDNLFYTYLPCCLSKIGQLSEIEYDICYFGTTYNRPRVNVVLQTLKDMGYRVKSTLFDGHIDPEDCIELYSKTICTISEMVIPVYIEYPVRLGECSANGCKLLMIDDLSIQDFCKSDIVPNYKQITNIQDVVDYIEIVKSNDTIRSDFYNEFNATYDNALNILMNVLNM